MTFSDKYSTFLHNHGYFGMKRPITAPNRPETRREAGNRYGTANHGRDKFSDTLRHPVIA